MVVIVNNVTAKNEEGDDKVIVKTAKGIEQDIKDLLRCAQPFPITFITRRPPLIADYATAL